MREIPRYVLYAVLAILAVLLVQAWEKQYPSVTHTVKETAAVIQSETKKATLGGFVPSMVKETNTTLASAAQARRNLKPATVSGGKVVWVKTDVLNVAIDASTGSVVETQLRKFPVSTEDKKTPVTLLSPQPSQLYLAQAGVVSSSGQQSVRFQAGKDSYVLQPGKDSIQVVLQGKTADGLAVSKTWLFKRNQYAIVAKTTLTNTGKKTWKGSLYSQLVRQPPEKSSKSMFGMHHYLGASTSSPKTPYEKIPFKTMKEKTLSRTNVGGWVAMQQHYFLSAWIPDNATEKHHFYTHYQAESEGHAASYTIGYLSPTLSVAAGKSVSNQSTLYVGPESFKRLSALAPGLNHTIDYGVLWPISIAIQWVMTMIVKVLPNWGVAIILATIIIKLLFYWFSSKSFISMAKMKELQPRIKGLKERFSDDKVGLQKATMELYKEKKVNPLGGCLPMLIQIPVFIALYWVITQSVDFRQAPFVFWIQDLSVRDPYFVLPILMMLTMILQQWLSPTSADPAQAKMMMIMPIAFAFLFRNFPAGLVLYWCVNNLVQALQQWYVMERYKAGKYKDKDRKKKRARARR
jgi:YidC/Oxa1 family membrane protein insertase